MPRQEPPRWELAVSCCHLRDTRGADAQQGGAAGWYTRGAYHGIRRLLQMSRAGQEGPHGAGQIQPPSGFLWAASRPCGACTPLCAEHLIACEAERLVACSPGYLVLMTLRVSRVADLPSTDAQSPGPVQRWPSLWVTRRCCDPARWPPFPRISFFQVSDSLPPSPLPFLNNLPLPAGHQGPLVSFWPLP